MMLQRGCDNGPFTVEGPGTLQSGACVSFHDGAFMLSHSGATSPEWDEQRAVVPLVPLVQVQTPPSINGEHGSADTTSGHTSQQPPNEPRKELLKLRKKLREIESIEKLIAAGTRTDPLQRAKVEKKVDLIQKIALAEDSIKEAELLNQAQLEWEQMSCWTTDNTQILWAPVLVPMNFTMNGTPCQLPQSCQDESGIHTHMEFGTVNTDMQVWHMAATEQAQIHAHCMTGSHLQDCHESQLLLMTPSQLQDSQVMQPPHNPSLETPADLLKCLESNTESLGEVVAAIQGSVLPLSLESTGCRVVQLALQLADHHTAAKLVAELKGHVRMAIKSPHGNYVIQQIVEVLPSAQSNFILQELQGCGAATARHRFGCRILCRLEEHCAGEAESLMKEVLVEAVELCRHTFGHHVIQSILEHGTREQHQKIVSALCADLHHSFLSRNASFVIEKILTYCAAEEHQRIVDAVLTSKPEVQAGALQGRLGLQLRKVSPKLASIASLKGLDGVRIATGRLQSSKQWKRSWKKFDHTAAAPAAVAAS